MKQARYFLVVRFTLAPGGERQVMRWLEGGHIAEVLAQPGFLWCRRLRVSDGSYAMLYGIESKAAFDAYESNAALKKKFSEQRKPFEHLMRIDRFAGEVDFALDKEG